MRTNKITKIILIYIIIQIINFVCINTSYSSDVTLEEIMDMQVEALDLSSFLGEVDKYTEDIYEDINMTQLFTSALTGSVDNDKIYKSILNKIGGEVVDAISVIGSIIVVIIIHSILKSVSDGLENQSISEITYYVQYILIVTLIMTNFVDIVNMVKLSVSSLVGFMNMLIPILLTLVMTTGSITTSSIMQPLLLFVITFMGNMINNFILPIVLVSTALGIVSKISSRLQVDRLSKFFKSSVIWVLRNNSYNIYRYCISRGNSK